MFINEENKAKFLLEAQTYSFPQLLEIFNRGQSDQLILNGKEEAILIVDLLIFMRNKIELQYPYHDEEHSHYSPLHDDVFSDFQMGIWYKVLSSLKTKFDVLLPRERTAA